MSFNTILYTCIIDWKNQPTIGKGNWRIWWPFPERTPPTQWHKNWRSSAPRDRIRTPDPLNHSIPLDLATWQHEANLPQWGLWLIKEKNIDQKFEAWLIRDPLCPYPEWAGSGNPLQGCVRPWPSLCHHLQELCRRPAHDQSVLKASPCQEILIHASLQDWSFCFFSLCPPKTIWNRTLWPKNVDQRKL